MPIDDDALVVSDNADIYGTVADLWERAYTHAKAAAAAKDETDRHGQ